MSFYYVLLAAKRTKNPGTRKEQSAFSLFKNCKQYLSVKKALSQTTYRSNTGERATRFSRNNSIAKNTAQTIPLLFLCLNGCLLCSLTVPVFLGNYLCYVHNRVIVLLSKAKELKTCEQRFFTTFKMTRVLAVSFSATRLLSAQVPFGPL